jgi:putative ABC transport system substrate-binding protein
MRRREFITLLGSLTASSSLSWPLAVRAQPVERMRRVGILLSATADDTEFQTWVGAFLQELQSLGWSIGRNVNIDTRWATANASRDSEPSARISTSSVAGIETGE